MGEAIARHRALLGATLVAVLATACIGSVDRETFEAEVAERGFGISNGLVDEAVAAVTDANASASVELTELYLYPQRAVLTARVPGQDALDSWTYSFGQLADPAPVNDTFVPENLEAVLFEPDDLDGVDVHDVVATAIEAAGIADGTVQWMAFMRSGIDEDGPIAIAVSVSGPRTDATVILDTDGRVVEVR